MGARFKNTPSPSKKYPLDPANQASEYSSNVVGWSETPCLAMMGS